MRPNLSPSFCSIKRRERMHQAGRVWLGAGLRGGCVVLDALLVVALFWQAPAPCWQGLGGCSVGVSGCIGLSPAAGARLLDVCWQCSVS